MQQFTKTDAINVIFRANYYTNIYLIPPFFLYPIDIEKSILDVILNYISLSGRKNAAS